MIEGRADRQDPCLRLAKMFGPDTMTMSDHAAVHAINDLQVSTALLQILVVHLTAMVANTTVEPHEWLRGFADYVHASIDRAAPPTDAQSQRMAEALRDQLDRLMLGVRSRLNEVTD